MTMVPLRGLLIIQTLWGLGLQFTATAGPVYAKLRVRKNIMNLTDQETHDLIVAFRLAKVDLRFWGFPYIASMHLYVCDAVNQTYPLGWNDPDMKKDMGMPFDMIVDGPYHRILLANVERALRWHVPNVTVPYLEVTGNLTKLPDLLNNETVWDPIEEKYVNNPLYSGYIPYDNFTTWRIINTSLIGRPDKLGHTCLYDMVYRALTAPNYKIFYKLLLKPHNIFHITFDNPNLYTNTFDPLFWIFHSYVDKVIAIFQEKVAELGNNIMHDGLTPKDREDMKSNYTVFYCDKKNLDKLPPYLKPIDSWDYKNHYGYEYDNLEYHGITVQTLVNTTFQPTMGKECKYPWEK